MTNQEIFDIVSAHLLKQNARSVKNGICRYRGPNGMMCAVGVLIPDDKYTKHFEGASVDRIHRKLGFEDDSLNILRELQGIHDHIEPNSWAAQLELVRRSFNLK